MESLRRPRPVLENAPGHTIRQSKRGWAIRWQARTDVVKLGYKFKSILLWKGLELSQADRQQISQRCHRYQADMLGWGLAHKAPPKQRQNVWTDEEDAIVAALSISNAFSVLEGRRTRMAIGQRKYKLRYPDDCLNTHSPSKGQRWSEPELQVMRTQFEVVDSLRNLKPLLPGRNLRQIQLKARTMGLRRKYLGDVKLPSEGLFDLLDQIRIRVKEDGISLRKFDRELGTGDYFGRSCRQRRKVNLSAIAKALQYYGAILTIDWRDR